MTSPCVLKATTAYAVTFTTFVLYPSTLVDMYSGLPEAKSGSGKSLEKVDVKQHAWAIPRLKPSLKKSSTVLPTNMDMLHHSRSSGLVDARPAPREGHPACMSLHLSDLARMSDGP